MTNKRETRGSLKRSRDEQSMALSLATATPQAQATLTTPTTETSYALTVINDSLASKVVVFKDEGG
jgi:hypothetical protein